MKTFLKKILIYGLPIIFYLLLVLIFDPYKHFWKSPAVDYERMITFSSKNHYALSKLSNLRETKRSVWIIGDSRSDQIKSIDLPNEEIKNAFINLSMGGANIDEIFSMFWSSINIIKPKEVYLGINWDIFSSEINKSLNRVEEAEELNANPLKYTFSKSVLKSVLFYLKNVLFSFETNIEKPNMDKASFWNYQIEVSSRNMLKNHRTEESLYERLDEIIQYCDDNDIKLKVFTPPTHVDLQKNINYFNQLDQYTEFKKYLEERVMFFDLDTENPFTTNKKNFKDPYHLERNSVSKAFNIIFSH